MSDQYSMFVDDSNGDDYTLEDWCSTAFLYYGFLREHLKDIQL